jgi:RimJ/RimL family protein N-acetyltransferase
MVRLFDDPDVVRWTPLPSPFDLAAAQAYLVRIRRAREAGAAIHLAITTDGQAALGEVLLFRVGDERRDVELAYAVGAEFRRQRLAVRAVQLMTDYACEHLAPARVVLRIAAANEASQAVARSAGFRLTGDQPVVRVRKGRMMTLFTWQLPAGSP